MKNKMSSKKIEWFVFGGNGKHEIPPDARVSFTLISDDGTEQVMDVLIGDSFIQYSLARIGNEEDNKE